jgi:Sulfotransferase family
MLRGNADEITARRVRGWALDDTDFRRVVNVVLTVNGVEYASPRADILRDDLQQEFGYGHHAFDYVFNPPLPLIRDHYVQLRYADTQQVIPNGELVLKAVALNGERLLQPILVTAPGRAGSTILMKRLAAHPSVSVAAVYPYETELLKYYSHAFEILTSPGDHERSGNPEGFVANQRFLGANPYNVPLFSAAFIDSARFETFHESIVPRAIAGAFRSIVNAFYVSLAADQDKKVPLFFAEKCQLAGKARWLARLLFDGSREIVLVRDVRDTICSYKSFWSHQTAEAVRLLKLSYDMLMAIRIEQRSDILFIRYEDMVEQEAEILQRIATFIGIRDFVAADEEQALFQQHGTSKTPLASIGRWKREMPAEEVKASTKQFAPFLEMFGYEV